MCLLIYIANVMPRVLRNWQIDLKTAMRGLDFWCFQVAYILIFPLLVSPFSSLNSLNSVSWLFDNADRSLVVLHQFSSSNFIHFTVDLHRCQLLLLVTIRVLKHWEIDLGTAMRNGKYMYRKAGDWTLARRSRHVTINGAKAIAHLMKNNTLQFDGRPSLPARPISL